MNQEGAQQQRHRGRGRYAERNGRHQRPTLLGVVGTLRGDHAAHVALAETLLGALYGAPGVPVRDPRNDRRADPRNGSQHTADARPAQYQKEIGQGIPHAGQLSPAHVQSAVLAQALACDRHVGDLRQREQPERQRHQRDAFEQVKGTERPAFDSGVGLLPHRCDHQADTGRGEPLEGIAAAEYADQRQPEDAEGKQFGGTETENEGPQQRDAEGEKQRAQQAAQHRSGKRRAEGSCGQTLLGHGVPVEDRRGGADRTGHSEQYGRNGVRRSDHGLQCHQKGKRGERIHVEREGQQQGQPDDTAQPGKHAQRQADGHAHGHDTESCRIEYDQQSAECGFKHGECNG